MPSASNKDGSIINIASFNGDKLILKWRDAQNEMHSKEYDYDRYRKIVDGLKKGPVKL